jgi:hypothetical protein
MTVSQSLDQRGACPSCGWEALLEFAVVPGVTGALERHLEAVRCQNPLCPSQRETGAKVTPKVIQPRRRAKRSRLTRRQRRAFGRRHDEDDHAWKSRMIRTLRFRDLPQLYVLHHDDQAEIEAIKLVAELKMIKWTRALALGVILLGIAVIGAASIIAAALIIRP